MTKLSIGLGGVLVGKCQVLLAVLSKLANTEHGLSHSFAQCYIGQAPLVPISRERSSQM